MELPPIALSALEQALNRYIALDPYTPARLGVLAGKVLGIELTGIDITLHLSPDDQGQLRVTSGEAADPDCVLRGSPVDLVRSRDPEQGKAQLFAGRVEIRGDVELGQRFGRILGELDIDWEEQLSHLVGDIAAHQIGRAARGLKDYADERRQAYDAHLGEYLTEELRVLPTRVEVEAQQRLIDRTRDDVERLAARIHRLKQRVESAEGEATE